MSDGTAVLIGALVSGLVGVLVVVLQQFLQRGRDRDRERIDRLAAFSAAAWAVTLDLGRLARAAAPEKEALADELEVRADRLNTALARIQLLDAEDLYRPAVLLDRELVLLLEAALEKQWSREEWRRRRADLSTAVRRFQEASRRVLGSAPLDLEVR